MEQPGLDDRERDKNGEIARKYGNTLVGTLRKIYGPGFAKGHGDHEKLVDVLHSVDAHSLTQLVHHHQDGTLEKKIEQHK